VPELSFLSVFVVGLLGGAHCVGMCGGIVGALSMQMPNTRAQWRYHAAYNVGRVSSYAVAGLLAGLIGESSLLLKGFLPVQEVMYTAANLLLIALGLYLAGLWQAVVSIERAGAVIWRRVQPLTRRFLPITSPFRAFILGALWGWLPCGLVYSVLVTALASGGALTGALLMLAFGVGTLPNLLAMGMFARQIKRFMQRRAVRLVAGLAVAGFGVLGLVRMVLFLAR